MNGILILIVIVAVIIGISVLGNYFSKIRYEKYMSNGLIKFESKIADIGFTTGKKTGVDYSWLYTNDADRKFTLFSGNPDKDLVIYSYEDLIDFELLEDGKCLISGKTTDTTAVATMNWTISENCINLQVLVCVKNSDRPEYILPLISPRTSISVNELFEIAKELTEDLSHILGNQSE